jgi:hypothetical protein
MFPQELDRFLKFFCEAINFICSGGEAKAGSRSCREAVVAMQGLGAVVAATNADAGGIKQGGDVVGMETIHAEGGQCAAVGLLLGGGSKNAHAFDGL